MRINFSTLKAEAPEQACFEEKVTESINKFEATSAHQQQKKLLVCNYCDEGFANEEELKDHTEIDYRSGRIRYRIT